MRKSSRNLKGRSGSVVLVAALACVLLATGLMGLAAAHGELKSGTPEEGATLKKAPKHAYLNFTEPPSADSVMKVFDGCGENVVTKLERFDITLHADLAAGQPGKWEIQFDVISDEDGHETKDSYGFTVKGQKDCSAEPDDSSGPDDSADQGDPQASTPVSSQGDGGGFPIVAVIIGALVLIGGAIALRARSTS